MDEIGVNLHIIFGILREREREESIQYWIPQPNQLHDTGILVKGGVARRRAEEPGDGKRRGHKFQDVHESLFHEKQYIYLLGFTGIFKNVVQLVRESELLL